MYEGQNGTYDQSKHDSPLLYIAYTKPFQIINNRISKMDIFIKRYNETSYTYTNMFEYKNNELTLLVLFK